MILLLSSNLQPAKSQAKGSLLLLQALMSLKFSLVSRFGLNPSDQEICVISVVLNRYLVETWGSRLMERYSRFLENFSLQE